MLEENLKTIFKNIENGNNLGEKITLVGATKMNSAETINEAIRLGLRYVAENKVQEFNEKHESLLPVHQHFIGHLQLNKVKYLIGKVELIQSVDRMELAKEIAKQSQNKNVTTDILLEVNIGKEETKSGFMPEDILSAYEEITKIDGIRVKGLMAMLPANTNTCELEKLCLQIRGFYDIMKNNNTEICYLSVGMSEDYLTAIKNGSNMIRIGSGIFGKRM